MRIIQPKHLPVKALRKHNIRQAKSKLKWNKERNGAPKNKRKKIVIKERRIKLNNFSDWNKTDRNIRECAWLCGLLWYSQKWVHIYKREHALYKGGYSNWLNFQLFYA